MKQIFTKFTHIVSILFFSIPSYVWAISFPGANRVFDEAERQFPQFLSPQGAKTKIFDEWIYRYYSDTDIYAGINTSDEVYLLIDGNLIYQGTVPEIENLLGINHTGGNNSGTGECVTMKLQPIGLMIQYKISIPSFDSPPEFLDYTLLDRTETMNMVRKVINSERNITEIIQQGKGYSANDRAFLESSDLTTTTTSKIYDLPPVVTKEHIEYKPAWFLGPYRKHCEGYTWLSASVSEETTIIDPVLPPDILPPVIISSTIPETGIVEEVNENINTPFGAVSTVRIRKDSISGFYSVTWASIEYGAIVRVETYTVSGVLGGLMEAQQLEVGEIESE